jgi:CRISPR-associated protein Cas5 subtype I-B
MRGISFELSGKYGHFKRPDTNDNPCTFSYMHKVAAIGLFGAILGIEREKMRLIYPQLCEDILFSISILNPIVKEPHGFTKRKTTPSHFFESGRRYCEYLVEPKYEIIFGINTDRSLKLFDEFCEVMQNNESIYYPKMGVENCKAYYYNVKNADISEEKVGEVDIHSVFSADSEIVDSKELSLIFECSPTHASDGYYTPGKWINTVAFDRGTVKIDGSHRLIDGKKAVCFF